jgi:hypothetical protein
MVDPHTDTTFDVLCHFEKINKFGHTMATNYYRALVHMTDTTGLSELPLSFDLYSLNYTNKCL